MSDSSTFVSTCIFVRSSAIEKRVGVWKEAATVCPTSTLREMTVPFTGEWIVAYSRFVRATRNAPSDCCRAASALLFCAAACSQAVCEESTSAWATKPSLTSSRFRRYVRSVSITPNCARSRDAFALLTLARACSTAASRSLGSISAITCPLRTGELKSTKICWIVPETWLPTETVETALMVPVAVMASTISPFSTFAVR